MAAPELVLPRPVSSSVGKLLVGLVCGALGLAIIVAPDVTNAPVLLAVGILLLVGAAYAILSALRELIGRGPGLRANHAGLWFGGGRVVPWTAVASIYAVDVDVRAGVGVSVGTGRVVAVTFRRKRTLLRLPPGYWISSLFFVAGDARIESLEANAHAIAARLEAIRTRVLGHEDGAVVGAADVPSARVVR